jgi:hypothetical protein
VKLSKYEVAVQLKYCTDGIERLNLDHAQNLLAAG